jgi:hypothetical protein
MALYASHGEYADSTFAIHLANLSTSCSMCKTTSVLGPRKPGKPTDQERTGIARPEEVQPLLVPGGLDAVTPARFAEDVARHLTNSQNLRIPFRGPHQRRPMHGRSRSAPNTLFVGNLDLRLAGRS